jgi:flagellar hook-length control protein FliK
MWRDFEMSSRSIHERLVALDKQMQAAAEAMDFELATSLRNESARIKGETPITLGDADTVTVSQPPPGAMGLGTHVPVRQPPKGWVKPKKPAFMTKNVKPRGGR